MQSTYGKCQRLKMFVNKITYIIVLLIRLITAKDLPIFSSSSSLSRVVKWSFWKPPLFFIWAHWPLSISISSFFVASSSNIFHLCHLISFRQSIALLFDHNCSTQRAIQPIAVIFRYATIEQIKTRAMHKYLYLNGRGQHTFASIPFTDFFLLFWDGRILNKTGRRKSDWETVKKETFYLKNLQTTEKHMNDNESRKKLFCYSSNSDELSMNRIKKLTFRNNIIVLSVVCFIDVR